MVSGSLADCHIENENIIFSILHGVLEHFLALNVALNVTSWLHVFGKSVAKVRFRLEMVTDVEVC